MPRPLDSMEDSDDQDTFAALSMLIDPQRSDRASSSTAPGTIAVDNSGSSGTASMSRWPPRKEKKRRVSTACIECRRRKSKCDGKSPCSGCQAKGLSCTMLFDDKRRKQSVAPIHASEPSDIQALKDRCRYLERLVMGSNRDEDDTQSNEQSPAASASGSNSQQGAPTSDRVTSPPRQFAARQRPPIESGQNFAGDTFGDISANNASRCNPVDSMTIPLFDFGTNDAAHRQPDHPSSAMAPNWPPQSVQDSAKSLQALSSTLNISNLNSWPAGINSLPSGSAAATFPTASSLSSGVPETSTRAAAPSAATYSGASDASASPGQKTRAIYVPPAQSLTEEDMLEPMPRTALETIHAGKATPSGVEAGSLAHQLTRRDGRMTLADGGRLRWYGATSSRSLSYGGLHFQSRGRKQQRDLNATCRMALNRAGYAPDSYFEDYGFQQRIVALFFKWANSFFVTVREDVFYRQWSRYRAVQDGNSRQAISPEEGQHFSLLLLYAILAVAAPMSDEAIHKGECGDSHETAGDVFASCARICLDEEIDLPQETTVQALAIMASREVMCGKDARGYAYIGMATSCALDLGLNTDVTMWLESGHVTHEQYLVRQTTWWGLFLYEKLWALYVGRPSLCRQVAVTVPLPESIEQLDGSPVNTVEARTKLDFVCRLVELLRITDGIVDALYSPFSQFEKTASELRTWSADVHNQLKSWLEGLPTSLKVNVDGDPDLCTSKPNILVLHMQYQVTIINLFRPFTCDIQRQQPLYNEAFKTCATAATKISALIERYRVKYTLRRIPLVAIHQFFTAASWHVFVIYACMLGCIPGPSYISLHYDAQRGLLTCLGGLAAIATSQVHARRSYLMVVLLMKRWGIRLNPACASSEADNLFQQTKAVGNMANNAASSTSVSTSQAPPMPPRSNSGIWTTSEGFAAISQELFALCGDGMFDASKFPPIVPPLQQSNNQNNQLDFSVPDQVTTEVNHQIPSMSIPAHVPESTWNHTLPLDFNSDVFANMSRPVATTSRQDPTLTDDQLKLFDFGLGSLDGLLSSPTNGLNLTDWDRPSLADIFDLSNFQ